MRHRITSFRLLKTICVLHQFDLRRCMCESSESAKQDLFLIFFVANIGVRLRLPYRGPFLRPATLSGAAVFDDPPDFGPRQGWRDKDGRLLRWKSARDYRPWRPGLDRASSVLPQHRADFRWRMQRAMLCSSSWSAPLSVVRSARRRATEISARVPCHTAR